MGEERDVLAGKNPKLSEWRKPKILMGERKKKNSAVENLLLSAHALDPEEKARRRHEEMKLDVVSTMKGEVARRLKEENSIQLQLRQDKKFPRPREQILPQQGFGDGGFDIFTSSTGRDPQGNRFHIKKDFLEKLRSSEGRKKTTYSLARAIMVGEHGDSLLARLKKAGGADALDSLRVETKTVADIVQEEDVPEKTPAKAWINLSSTISQSKGETKSKECEVLVQLSLLHLAVIENQPKTFETLLKALQRHHEDYDSNLLPSVISCRVEVHHPQLGGIQSEGIFMHQQNILHLATEYSFPCLNILLNWPGDLQRAVEVMINEEDHNKKTPIHLAAINATSEAAKALVQHPEANLVAQDADGNTPLHMACRLGVEEIIYVLLSVSTKDEVNARNKKEKTPIFYARTPKMVQLLSLHEDTDLRVKDKDQNTLLEGLLRTNGECAKALLSSGVSTNGKEYTDRDLLLIYDLEIFTKTVQGTESRAPKYDRQPSMISKMSSSSVKGEPTSESEILSTFLRFGRKSLLAHPLAETFIHLKGLATNNFFKINVLTFFLYLISFTSLVDWTSAMKYDRNDTCQISISGCQTQFDDKHIEWFLKEGGDDWKTPVWFLVYSFTVVCLTLFTAREFLQLKNAGLRYFRSKENILEVITLFCTWIYLGLVIWPVGYEWETTFSVIAVFCAWIEMSLMIGRFPSIGIFTFMMFQVINQLIKFLIVYSTTLIAFAHVFHLLLIRDEKYAEEDGGNGVFDSIWSSFLKVLMMMIGEYEFAEVFTLNNIRASSVVTGDSLFAVKIIPVLVQFFFLAMIFLGSIIIANLITGLTIHNISELYKEAEVFKLGSAVRQIVLVEDMVKTSKMFYYLKKFLPKRFGRTSIIEKLSLGSDETVLTVCVKPNEFGTYDFSTVKITSTVHLPIYVFDRTQNSVGRKLKMTIQSGIVKNTFDVLSKKDSLQRELRETFQIEDSKSTSNKYFGGEDEIYGYARRTNFGKPRQSRISMVNQGSNEIIHTTPSPHAKPKSERRESAMLGGIPTQESFEEENVEILQDDLSMMTTLVKRFQKNAGGKLTDKRLTQALQENIKILRSIADECDDDTHL